MKVAIDVSQVAYRTGVASYTLNLVNALDKIDGLDLSLFGFAVSHKTHLQMLLPRAKIFPLPARTWDFLFNKIRLLSVEMFTDEADVYHASDWTQIPSRCKKVTTVHDLSPFIYPLELDPEIVEVHTRKMRLAVKECDKFICVSQNTANDLQRLFAVAPEKIVVIHEALEQNYLLKPQITKLTDYILTIGARQPRKNIKRLISAYLANRDALDLPNKLIIVGENAWDISDPNIIFTGFISDQDLVNYMAAAKCFIYPSLYEGFGLPILGAFYHQVPVACANTSSLPEVAGAAAILFDPYNEQAMAQAIRQALDTKEKLIMLGKQQLALFSWDTAAKQTAAVYTSLC